LAKYPTAIEQFGLRSSTDFSLCGTNNSEVSGTAYLPSAKIESFGPDEVMTPGD
jgi:hypothetical protein